MCFVHCANETKRQKNQHDFVSLHWRIFNLAVYSVLYNFPGARAGAEAKPILCFLAHATKMEPKLKRLSQMCFCNNKRNCIHHMPAN